MGAVCQRRGPATSGFRTGSHRVDPCPLSSRQAVGSSSRAVPVSSVRRWRASSRTPPSGGSCSTTCTRRCTRAASARPTSRTPSSSSSATSPSADDWDALLADVRPDTVVHLAAETGTAQSLTESTRHGMVNVVGTTAAARRPHPRRPRARPRRADQRRARSTARGCGATPTARRFQPGLRTHAQLEAGRGTTATGRPRRPTPWPAPRPTPDQRLRRHQAGPGAHPRGVGRARTTSGSRCCGCRTSTAPASR